MGVFHTIRQLANVVWLSECPTEHIPFWLRVVAWLCTVLSLILLLVPSIITHSVQCLALVLSPIFLFAAVEMPRFQWPKPALDIVRFQVQPPQVSLFKRPPPLS